MRGSMPIVLSLRFGKQMSGGPRDEAFLIADHAVAAALVAYSGIVKPKTEP